MLNARHLSNIHEEASPMAHIDGAIAANASHDIRQTVDVMGCPIDAVQWAPVVELIVGWAEARESRYACICNVHLVVTASQDSQLALAVKGADLATPDGMPVALCVRLAGFPDQPRIAGPDLMWACLGAAQRERLGVFFYGATPETLARLEARMGDEFPGLSIAGSYSPPFRDLTLDEDREVVDQIDRSGAQLVFVGLGCPKQEIWMSQHRGRVRAVMLGVGAAFDFHAGTVKRAPVWMQRSGLEWLHRLFSEPRRLWRRYLITGSIFIWYMIRLLPRSLLRRFQAAEG